MSFKIIETFLKGKGNDPELCEDRIVVTEHMVCVIDGATKKSVSDLYEENSPGIIAGRLIEEAVAECGADAGIEKLIADINRRFADYYRTYSSISHMRDNPVDRLTASVAVYSDRWKKMWMVGDCQAIAGGVCVKNDKAVDRVLSELRAFMVEYMLGSGTTVEELRRNDTARDEIMPFLIKQSYFQNNNFGSRFSYGVIDGFDINPAEIREYRLGPGSGLVMASDGYPELFGTLAGSEEHLRYIIENDPLCYKLFKSTKGVAENNISFDDRAYIRLEIE